MAQIRTENRRELIKRRRQRLRRRRTRSLLILIFMAVAVAAGISAGVTARRNMRGRSDGIPLYLQTDERWKDMSYGSSTIGISGCGPVCLSMAAAGVMGNEEFTPVMAAEFSEENGYYVSGVGTSWDLMTDGAKKIGLKVNELPLDEGFIKKELTRGHPVICSVKPGDFTNEGHFIVLVDYRDGMVYLNDPNSAENSAVPWSYERLEPQIGAMWSYR